MEKTLKNFIRSPEFDTNLDEDRCGKLSSDSNLRNGMME
jgi:hypothetical protein